MRKGLKAAWILAKAGKTGGASDFWNGQDKSDSFFCERSIFMKKEFETPVCEVVEFENEDILTASNVTPGTDD